MDFTKSKRGKLSRTIAKVLNLRAATGIAPDDAAHKINSKERAAKVERIISNKSSSNSQQFDLKINDEKLLYDRVLKEAVLAKLFAGISTIKASYAQLQSAQSPYDADEIQAADQVVVLELKNLSKLKQCYIKKEFDFSPESALVMADIQEQKSLLKTYEIMGKKLECQLKLKDSEMTFLGEKLEESNKQNKLMEKMLTSSGPLFALDSLHQSGLSPTHFIAVLQQTVKSIRSFVRLMISEMESAGWDFDAAADAIEPGVKYWKPSHKCFAFESFVCREMFDYFQYPYFSLPTEPLPEKGKRKEFFFQRFTELKSLKTKEYISLRPNSAFVMFCRVKYLRLVHPEMESSFYGNLNQRTSVKSGQFPETPFCTAFGEMAKHVWLLHCLAFSYDPQEASVFQVRRKCRFSEVYMESVADEAFLPSEGSSETDPQVAFTVVPGFQIGKTVLQCEVYLSKQLPNSRGSNPFSVGHTPHDAVRPTV